MASIGEESLLDEEKKEWLRLRNVVLAALDEEKRFPSLMAFAEAIRGNDEIVVASSSLPQHPAAVPRRRMIFLWGCVTALVVLIGAGIWFYQHQMGISKAFAANETEAVAPTSGVSSDRLDELNALSSEAEGKLDAFKKTYSDRFEFNVALDSLKNIDAKDPDADRELSDFLSRYGSIRIPKPLQPEDHARLAALFSYVGRIYDWAKTDPEKELADIRSKDFNQQLVEPLNSFNESQAAEATTKIALPYTIRKMASDREEAAKARELGMQPNQVTQEETKASDFITRLQAWYQQAQEN